MQSESPDLTFIAVLSTKFDPILITYNTQTNNLINKLTHKPTNQMEKQHPAPLLEQGNKWQYKCKKSVPTFKCNIWRTH